MKLINKNTKAGFTLVELIVVIAILGILAGVAIPVYSGYIKKANQAADNTLLSAVNTAFSAACIENRTANTEFADNAVQLAISEKKITGVSGTNVTDAINTSFGKYFDDNDDIELKYYSTASDFEFKDGLFYGKGTASGGSVATALRSGSATLSNGNTLTATSDGYGNIVYTVTDGENDTVATYTVSKIDLDNFEGSVYNRMGVTELLGQVGVAVNAATAVNSLAEIAGKLLPSDILANVTKTDDVYDKTSLANALVLYTASQAADPSTASSLATSFTNGTFVNATRNALTSQNYSTLIPNVALAYGAITGYVNSDAAENTMITLDKAVTIGATTVAAGQYTAKQYYNSMNSALASASGGTEATNALLGMMTTFATQDSNFGTYMQSPNFTNDLAGYLSALSAVKDNTTQLVNSGAVTNGYGGDITATLSGIFGGN